ncbi:MAG TPA: hypothetical protein VJW73_19635, partial [Gemmatimonadaceae bacterium]|nr:hypothetical protein [Gemmatimonadaceae bacterium]
SFMFRALLFVSVATAAVVLLVRQSPRSAMNRTRRLRPRAVPATEAAERLRDAWGDYHTVA